MGSSAMRRAALSSQYVPTTARTTQSRDWVLANTVATAIQIANTTSTMKIAIMALLRFRCRRQEQGRPFGRRFRRQRADGCVLQLGFQHRRRNNGRLKPEHQLAHLPAEVIPIVRQQVDDD